MLDNLSVDKILDANSWGMSYRFPNYTAPTSDVQSSMKRGPENHQNTITKFWIICHRLMSTSVVSRWYGT